MQTQFNHDKKVIYPFGEIPFIEKWIEWLDYKRETFGFRYKTARSEQTAVNHLHGLAGGDHRVAIEIIDQSIGNQWRGLFKLHNDGTPKTKPGVGASGRQYDSINGIGQDLFEKLSRLDGTRDSDS